MSKQFGLLRLSTLFTVALIIITVSAFSLLYPRIKESREGCTSWIAIKAINVNNGALEGDNNILHKTRDMTDVAPMVKREISNGLYKYMGYASSDEDLDDVKVWGGINEAGLAVASNYIGWVNFYGKYGGPSVCREILEHCASVEDAYDWLAINKNSINSGNIIFLADSEIGAIVEVKVNFSSAEITSLEESVFPRKDENGEPVLTVTGKPDINFRSNHYKILSNYSQINSGTSSYERYERLINLLTHIPEDTTVPGYYGIVNITNCQAISALENEIIPETEEEIENAICRESTKGRMTFEINKNDPLKSTLSYGGGYRDGDEYINNRCSGDHVTHNFSKNEIISYDFSGIPGDDSDFNIFECDVDIFPFNGNPSNRNDKDEPTDNEYISISTPNSTRWSSDDPGNYDEMILWVEMTINEHPSDIQHIEFVFQGNSSQNNDFEIYVKKTGLDWIDNDSWVKAGTSKRILSGDDDVIRRVLDTDLDLFIDNSGMITWIVGAPEGHSDSINTNYVKIDVVMPVPVP